MAETPSPSPAALVLVLPPEALRRRTDPAALPFESSDEAAPLEALPGQERALDALRFGLAMRHRGYNLFALGPPSAGKHDTVRAVLEEHAARQPSPPDWCYVFNFADPYRPRALSLPSGRGAAFRRDMERLITELRAAITRAFDSEDVRARRRLLEEELKQRQERAFAEVEKHAGERRIALLRTPMGLALAPSRDGEVIEPEEFRKLPEAEQERYKADMKALQEELQATLAALPGWEREQREKQRDLERDVTRFAVDHLIDELRGGWADVPAVISHLEAVQQDVLENADELIQRGPEEGLPALLRRAARPDARPFRRYEVNLLVDRSGASGAPVVYEDYPSHANLLGRVEHLSEMGALVTDFHMIKPGALHRANGGYLLLDVRKVLMQPLAWEQLKRALRSREVRIESLSQALGLLGAATLDPEPVPLDLKLVLVGDRQLYYLLAALDPDFLELFKVAADFEERLPRGDGGEIAYARMLAGLARRDGLLPLERGAVARVIEHGARLAGDAERLLLHVEGLSDLAREADHWARAAGSARIRAEDVERAILAQERRADRVRERLFEEIQRGTLRIETQGERSGQVNGLSVLQLGGFSFGRPSRITARVRLGSGQLLDIEREVALGGPIHSKGVLILGGFLGARYSPERPLSLAASLVFEQSYGGIEGDSASLAELVALLSALAEAPVRQSLAVTGSVDQEGRVQAVGGVNEKIEGFFDICRARGLDGEQGVLLPAANVKHLMLRQDVVEAAAQNRFRVFAVESVDQALELLTGLPAGERGADGSFPEGSLNRRVEARLAGFAEKARSFGRLQAPPNGQK